MFSLSWAICQTSYRISGAFTQCPCRFCFKRCLFFVYGCILVYNFSYSHLFVALQMVCFESVYIKKSNLSYSRIIPIRMSRVRGAHLRGFAPRPTHQGYSSGESLAKCRRSDRIGIWSPYLSQQKQKAYHLCHLVVRYTGYIFSCKKKTYKNDMH